MFLYAFYFFATQTFAQNNFLSNLFSELKARISQPAPGYTFAEDAQRTQDEYNATESSIKNYLNLHKDIDESTCKLKFQNSAVNKYSGLPSKFSPWLEQLKSTARKKESSAEFFIALQKANAGALPTGSNISNQANIKTYDDLLSAIDHDFEHASQTGIPISSITIGSLALEKLQDNEGQGKGFNDFVSWLQSKHQIAAQNISRRTSYYAVAAQKQIYTTNGDRSDDAHISINVIFTTVKLVCDKKKPPPPAVSPSPTPVHPNVLNVSVDQKQKAEKQRIEQQKIDQQNADKLKLDKQKAEQKKAEQLKFEQERAQKLKLAQQQKVNQENAQKLKLAQQQKLNKQKVEVERAKALKMAQQKLTQQKADQLKAEKRKADTEKADREKADREKAKKQELAKQLSEQRKHTPLKSNKIPRQEKPLEKVLVPTKAAVAKTKATLKTFVPKVEVNVESSKKAAILVAPTATPIPSATPNSLIQDAAKGIIFVTWYGKTDPAARYGVRCDLSQIEKRLAPLSTHKIFRKSFELLTRIQDDPIILALRSQIETETGCKIGIETEIRKLEQELYYTDEQLYYNRFSRNTEFDSSFVVRGKNALTLEYHEQFYVVDNERWLNLDENETLSSSVEKYQEMAKYILEDLRNKNMKCISPLTEVKANP